MSGGLETSSSCKQHGQQHDVQRKGRFKRKTSWFLLSIIFMLNDLFVPQHCRVQQSFSTKKLENFGLTYHCKFWKFWRVTLSWRTYLKFLKITPSLQWIILMLIWFDCYYTLKSVYFELTKFVGKTIDI